MNMLDPTSILIAGTGALASLFAARLTSVGVSVTMLGTWHEGVTELGEHGVCLVGDDGVENNYPVRVVSGDDEYPKARLALVLVKSWQTERTARQLVECLTPDGLVLTLQNGLGNREKLIESLGSTRVVQGVTTTGATLLGPGRVRLSGEGKISLEKHPRMGEFISLFSKARFTVETVDNVTTLVWIKLVINAAINPLTALLRVPNGELLARPSACILMNAAAQEALAVAVAQGIPFPFEDPGVVVEGVARRTAQNRSSMLQDVTRGAPTEIDAICGAIVRAGEQVGVPTPVNRMLWLLVKAIVES